jgi:hypothetical protein
MESATIEYTGTSHSLTWEQSEYSDKWINHSHLKGWIDGHEIPGYFFTLDSLKLYAIRVLVCNHHDLIPEALG